MISLVSCSVCVLLANYVFCAIPGDTESEAAGDVAAISEDSGEKQQEKVQSGSDWLHDWGVDSLTSQLQSKVGLCLELA